MLLSSNQKAVSVSLTVLFFSAQNFILGFFEGTLFFGAKGGLDFAGSTIGSFVCYQPLDGIAECHFC